MPCRLSNRLLSCRSRALPFPPAPWSKPCKRPSWQLSLYGCYFLEWQRIPTAAVDPKVGSATVAAVAKSHPRRGGIPFFAPTFQARESVAVHPAAAVEEPFAFLEHLASSHCKQGWRNKCSDAARRILLWRKAYSQALDSCTRKVCRCVCVSLSVSLSVYLSLSLSLVISYSLSEVVKMRLCIFARLTGAS